MTARALGLDLEIHVLNAESGDTKSKVFSKVSASHPVLLAWPNKFVLN